MDALNNVLVVEDDPALSKLVSGLLDEAGYRSVTIADHALIGAAVDRWEPRLVILDGEIVGTGEARSWDDAVAIRRAHPELPVVMFSADGTALAEAREGTSARSRAASFAGIVGKPFVVEEFLPPSRARRTADSRKKRSTTRRRRRSRCSRTSGTHLVTDWPTPTFSRRWCTSSARR